MCYYRDLFLLWHLSLSGIFLFICLFIVCVLPWDGNFYEREYSSYKPRVCLADFKCWLNKWMNESPKADPFHSEIVSYLDFAGNSNHCLEIHTWMSSCLLNSSPGLSDRNPTFNIVHNIPPNFSNQICSKSNPCFNHLK